MSTPSAPISFLFSANETSEIYAKTALIELAGTPRNGRRVGAPKVNQDRPGHRLGAGPLKGGHEELQRRRLAPSPGLVAHPLNPPPRCAFITPPGVALYDLRQPMPDAVG